MSTAIEQPPVRVVDEKTRRFYGGRDPRDIPAYSIPDVAKAAGVSAETLRRWVAFDGDSPPLINMADPDTRQLSYTNLFEAHVLAGLRKIDRVPMLKVRRALPFVEEILSIEHPLASQRFETDGIDLFVQISKSLITASRFGQIKMREMLMARLKRVTYAPDGTSGRVYPGFGALDDQAPQLIVVDPFVCFGQATIAGTRIPTRVIAQRFKAKETIEEIAFDYDRSTQEIEAALQYEKAA